QNTGKHEAESAALWKFARSVLSAK
ncbi:MAG: hypothetical protein QOG41_1109, partial [Thermoleophilaceae bacterium]|nr:hypothetical protein [Thermoleophilaceae bacterium]